MLIKGPPVEITDNLLMLGTSEYPLFLFRGASEGTVFEGGTSTMGPLLGQQLEKLGITKEFVRQAIITHAHPDHVMAVPLFREMFPGITVIASEIAAKTLSSPKAMSFFRQVDDAFTASLKKAGLVSEEHCGQGPVEGEIAIDRTVKEGDTIAVDAEVSFEVLETPGHSDCSLSFHEPGARILIISDATGYYIPEHDWWWPNYFVGYDSYMRSMRRLSGLEAEIVCLSHNGVIKGAGDAKAYFEAAISATQAYHDRIVDEARQGKALREIAGQLGREVYEKTQLLPLEFFQKNCALMVKQSLQHAGLSVEK